MQDKHFTRSSDDSAPSVGTLHYSEGGGLSVPQNLGGLSRRRGNLSDKLVRGWRVMLRPADDRPGMPLREISAGETLMPVGTVTHAGGPGEFRYQPMLYANANLQEYRARRRRSEQIGRFMLGAMAMAVTVSVGIVLFVHPGARKPVPASQPVVPRQPAVQAAPAAPTAPVAPAAPAFLSHEIRKGDTLSGVAKRYKVKLKTLMDANGLGEKSRLQIGQVIRVPQAAGLAALAVGAPAVPAVAAPPVLAVSAPQVPVAAGPLRTSESRGSQMVAALAGPVAGVPALREQRDTPPAALRQPGRDAAEIPAPRLVRSVGPRTYKVRKGDFSEIIAKRHGIRPETLLFANGLHERSVLRPGQELKVPPADGYYHTVRRGETLSRLLRRAGVDEAKFRRLNPEVGEILRAKQMVFIPGKVPDIAPPRKERGAERAQNKRFRDREERKRASRGFWGDIGRAVSDGFNWPISSRAISSGFGERGRDWHPGLDIRADTGTPIRAARDGVVVRSGWEGAYGRMVEIDHGGGVRTRYAHASKLLVKPGEQVRAGEIIGRVGSTGRSTGPHLHYEVRVNGRAVNPKKVH